MREIARKKINKDDVKKIARITSCFKPTKRRAMWCVARLKIGVSSARELFIIDYVKELEIYMQQLWVEELKGVCEWKS